MSEWFERRRFMVTGGAGFLGTRVVAGLEQHGAREVFVPRSDHYDLRELEACQQAIAASEPEIVTHAAATVGGIGLIATQPATFFYDNAAMGLHVVEACRHAEVEKLVTVGSVCSYPAAAPRPVPRVIALGRLPGGDERAVRPREEARARPTAGLSRPARLRERLPAARKPLRPGRRLPPGLVTRHPGADPQVRRSGRERRTQRRDIWGSGEAIREFLYVDDAVDAILLAAERIETPQAVNIGTGREISICQLAECIARETGFEGELTWDRTRPDGQARRALDVTAARARLGWSAATTLEEGLRATIAWWRGGEQAAA